MNENMALNFNVSIHDAYKEKPIGDIAYSIYRLLIFFIQTDINMLTGDLEEDVLTPDSIDMEVPCPDDQIRDQLGCTQEVLRELRDLAYKYAEKYYEDVIYRLNSNGVVSGVGWSLQSRIESDEIDGYEIRYKVKQQGGEVSGKI